jgi:hypothetical protein
MKAVYMQAVDLQLHFVRINNDRRQKTFSNSAGCNWCSGVASPEHLAGSHKLCRRSPARLILEIDIGELLAAVVADDKAGVLFLNRPGRRDAARNG